MPIVEAGEKGRYDTGTKAKTAPAEPKPKTTRSVRHAQDEAEIMESLQNMPAQYQTARKPAYGGKPQTDAAKAESLNRSIDFAVDTLKRSNTGKVDLDNPENIRIQAEVFLNACKKAGVVPTFEKLIASMGYSRQWIHKYMHDHAGSESVRVLDNIHTIFVNVMTEQALYRNFSEAVTIFLLKNAQGQEYADKSEVVANYSAHERQLPSKEQLIAQMQMIDGSGTDPEWNAEITRIFEGESNEDGI